MEKLLLYLIVMCVAFTMQAQDQQIPMSHSSYSDMVSLSHVDSLPVLPIDLSHIQHIDIPAPSVADKEEKKNKVETEHYHIQEPKRINAKVKPINEFH